MIGERINARRSELKMSLRDLAREIGVDHALVGKWEKGKIDVRDIYLAPIAKALDVSVEYLSGEMAPENETQAEAFRRTISTMSTVSASYAQDVLCAFAALEREEQKIVRRMLVALARDKA